MIATVAAIRRYPTKSLAPEDLDACELEVDGLMGDRRDALIIQSEHARRGKPYRGKEHDGLHYVNTSTQAIELAKRRNIVASVASGGRFFDDAAISIVADRWLAQLLPHLGYIPEFERFRPNFYLKTTELFPEHEEDFIGTRLRIGQTQLEVVATIKRCVAVTYDQNGGPSDPHILRVIANERENVMGVYCNVMRIGTIQRGDAVLALEA